MGVRELVPEIFMEQLYILLSFISLIGAIMVITSLNPIHSVFWLVLLFLNTSSLLILLGFNFIPLMLIIVYVGAIAILFLFVIMMLDILQLKKVESISNVIPIILCVFINILTQLILYFRDYNIILNLDDLSVWYLNSDSQVSFISKILYSFYGYPFIIISLLLLVAMVGAIILVLDLGVLSRKQTLVDQHQRLVNK